jgi:thioredoxin 1
MRDKKERIAIIAVIAGIAIVGAIFLIPFLGCTGSDGVKNTGSGTQSNPTPETMAVEAKEAPSEVQSVPESNPATIETKNTASKGIRVTFVELGSVKCIPCKMMQPVMKKIEETYSDSVKVVFYDVWTEKDKAKAGEYGINAIPTQVFLDSNGKEYFRHAGFFPFEEVEKILKMQL